MGDVMQLRPEDLGSAALVEERRVGKEKQMIFVEGCEKAELFQSSFMGSRISS